ncbi:hypothetical protein [Actinomadura sp. NPDC000929]|uniref:hypothetical protein n=1 Tax=Actinomadura sp. NPDC000929 TaxID=3154517 RepID=UPI00339B85FE
MLGKNPGRAFIDAPGDGGFATAPDLARFARAQRAGGVILTNRDVDGGSLVDIIRQEMKAVTGAEPGPGSGG